MFNKGNTQAYVFISKLLFCKKKKQEFDWSEEQIYTANSFCTEEK